MSTEPSPPAGAPAHTGQDSVWDFRFRMLEDGNRRIERKIDGILDEQGSARGRHGLLDQRLATVESWKSAQETDQRQLGIGTKLAIIAGIISPVLVLVFEAIRHG